MDDPKILKAYLLAEDKTAYYADSVEWCPFNHMSNFFVCGTYQLDEESSNESQVRTGNLVLYKLDFNNEDLPSNFKLSIIEDIPTSGILDIKWCPQLLSGKVALAFVCSDGKLLLKYVDESGEIFKLSDLIHYDLAQNEEKLVLSVDWCWQNESSAFLMASDTKGTLNYFQITESNLRLLNSWKAHNFEAWISSFNYFDSNIVFSGADDCLFKGWDVRNLSSPIFISKRHSMGVTAISKSKLNENLLVSGSYDEHICLWDVRNMKYPVSDLSVGGGVWRLKWHPKDSNALLSASMLNGFHIVSIKSNQLQLDLAYNGHKSLAYGADWSHAPPNAWTKCDIDTDNDEYKLNIIASCSFYDNLLHVWGINF